MCGIVAFWDKTGQYESASGRIILTMLEALGCRGPDSAGIAMIGPETESGAADVWSIRLTGGSEAALGTLSDLGEILPADTIDLHGRRGSTSRIEFRPETGVTADDVERAPGARRGGVEILSLGRRLDLVKQVGTPAQLEAAFAVSTWTGPLGIGHTRMSTESRIDLSHSQPFWAHGVPDLATVHNGHVTNYHQLRRRYEQQGFTFYTDNDSEVIGVYLRDRMTRGRDLAGAMTDSIVDLDGAFNYLVASSEGLGIVRDRFGFKPLMLAETDRFVAVATEEIALRRALPGPYRVLEPPTGTAIFYPIGNREPSLV